MVLRDYYKTTAETYNKLGNSYLRLIADKNKVVRREFIKKLSKNARVLDVGCAGGSDAKAFTKAGLTVTGVDVSEPFLKQARKAVPTAKFYRRDLRRLDFGSNQFDAIWAMAVLLHIVKKDIPKVLKNFYRILKPGGLLTLGVKKGKGVKIERADLTGALGSARLFVYFEQRELNKFVTTAGFKIVKSKIKPDPLGRPSVKWIIIFARKV